MLLLLAVLAAAVLGGFGRRVAGGLIGDLTGHPPSHFLATVFYGFTVGVPGFFGLMVTRPEMFWPNAAFGLVAGFNAWLGHIMGLHESAGMGHLPPDNLRWSFTRFCRDFAGMLLYGVLSVVLMALFILFCPLGIGLHVIPLAIGAWAIPIIYMVTWKIFSLKPFGWPTGFGPPLGLAEPFVGASIAVAACTVG